MARKTNKPAQTMVMLMREHTHLSKKHAAGTSLSVHPHTADWLIAAGVATLGQQAQDPTTTPTQKD